jgi:hypothetical protein
MYGFHSIRYYEGHIYLTALYWGICYTASRPFSFIKYADYL